jgi:adenylate cyclase
VTRSGRAVGRDSFPVDERPPPPAEGGAASEAGAQRPGNGHEPSTPIRVVSDWFANLPRPAAVLLTVAGFLIVINVFTGLHRIWFHWPVAALLFIVVLQTVRRRKPASDRKDERRTDRE